MSTHHLITLGCLVCLMEGVPCWGEVHKDGKDLKPDDPRKEESVKNSKAEEAQKKIYEAVIKDPPDPEEVRDALSQSDTQDLFALRDKLEEAKEKNGELSNPQQVAFNQIEQELNRRELRAIEGRKLVWGQKETAPIYKTGSGTEISAVPDKPGELRAGKVIAGNQVKNLPSDLAMDKSGRIFQSGPTSSPPSPVAATRAEPEKTNPNPQFSSSASSSNSQPNRSAASGDSARDSEKLARDDFNSLQKKYGDNGSVYLKAPSELSSELQEKLLQSGLGPVLREGYIAKLNLNDQALGTINESLGSDFTKLLLSPAEGKTRFDAQLKSFGPESGLAERTFTFRSTSGQTEDTIYRSSATTDEKVSLGLAKPRFSPSYNEDVRDYAQVGVPNFNLDADIAADQLTKENGGKAPNLISVMNRTQQNLREDLARYQGTPQQESLNRLSLATYYKVPTAQLETHIGKELLKHTLTQSEFTQPMRNQVIQGTSYLPYILPLATGTFRFPSPARK